MTQLRIRCRRLVRHMHMDLNTTTTTRIQTYTRRRRRPLPQFQPWIRHCTRPCLRRRARLIHPLRPRLRSRHLHTRMNPTRNSHPYLAMYITTPTRNTRRYQAHTHCTTSLTTTTTHPLFHPLPHLSSSPAPLLPLDPLMGTGIRLRVPVVPLGGVLRLALKNRPSCAWGQLSGKGRRTRTMDWDWSFPR